MSSSRSLPARTRGKGPGQVGGRSSRSADRFGCLLGGMQDEPEFGLGGSTLKSNSDAGILSESEEGGGSDSSLAHPYRQSTHCLPTSKLFVDIIYAQATYVPRRTALAPREDIRCYSDFVDTRLMSSSAPTSLALAHSAASMTSSVSTASNMTKSGLSKGERDTTCRRLRHRDGKLLRDGIGPTTGFGQSNGEDDDAPNPLTRQLSSVGLRRKAAMEAREREKETEKEGLSRARSVSSMAAVRPGPLRREMEEGVGGRESIMNVGSTGNEGYTDISVPQSTSKYRGINMWCF
jgi:hypothetical protein